MVLNYTESAEIENCSIVSTKVYYFEHNKQALPASRMKLNPTERKCIWGYTQIRKDGAYREVDFGNMTEQLQTDYDMHKGAKAEIYHVGQFD